MEGKRMHTDTRKGPVLINVICDDKSWEDLLGQIKEPHRFSRPEDYDELLLIICGRPILVDAHGLPIHIYPPRRDTK